MATTDLSDNRALCHDIERMIGVSLEGARRPIFPVKDAAAILARRHRLRDDEHHQLIALISQRCVGKGVPRAFDDFDRLRLL